MKTKSIIKALGKYGLTDSPYESISSMTLIKEDGSIGDVETVTKWHRFQSKGYVCAWPENKYDDVSWIYVYARKGKETFTRIKDAIEYMELSNELSA